MSRNARIEEVSDSDSDPGDMDPSDFDPSSIIAPANISRPPPPRASQQAQQAQQAPPLQSQIRPPVSDLGQGEQLKRWQCLYPVYFDASRSRAEGRRVGKELAVANPLAREMADAVAAAGFNVALEPSKTHPKDWANPGRVKVLFKEDGALKNSTITNKHHLYIIVAQWLKAHPTTEQSPLRLPVAGLPHKPAPPPVVPKGFKMNKILPLHSPAVSGGGISENMLKDMMQEMQGGAPAGQLETTASNTPKKKEKKKNKG